MRYEQSEFVKNYKPKGGEPPVPSPQPNPTPVDHGNDDLLKRLEAIEKEREQFKKTSFEKSLREKVINKAGSLNVSNKALWEDVAGMIPITDGMDESKLEEETKRLYESKLKAITETGLSRTEELAVAAVPIVRRKLWMSSSPRKRKKANSPQILKTIKKWEH